MNRRKGRLDGTLFSHQYIPSPQMGMNTDNQIERKMKSRAVNGNDLGCYRTCTRVHVWYRAVGYSRRGQWLVRARLWRRREERASGRRSQAAHPTRLWIGQAHRAHRPGQRLQRPAGRWRTTERFCARASVLGHVDHFCTLGRRASGGTQRRRWWELHSCRWPCWRMHGSRETTAYSTRAHVRSVDPVRMRRRSRGVVHRPAGPMCR